MAEFLIKAQTYTHADPVKDRRGVYKIGDIVCVMPDGHSWGAEEGLPKFWIVKVPGLAVATGQLLTVPYMDVLAPTTVYRRRKHFLDGTRIPTNTLNRLNRDGVVTINTWQAVQQYIVDKTTGAPIG